MTNLSAGSGSVRPNRGLILRAVPLFIGALATGCLVVWQLLPALERNRALEDRLMQIRAQVQELPELRQRLEAANHRLQKAQHQQVLLLDLMAGRERIQTFLSLLDQWAVVTGVTLQRFEPLPPPPSDSASKTSRNGRNQKSSPQKPTDPLKALGYRQTAVALNVVGPFNGLQRFLQALESLEMLVESSDLSLRRASNSSAASEADGPVSVEMILSLKLSFYDRLPTVESDTKSSRPQQALS